jgi:hypothetical protein
MCLFLPTIEREVPAQLSSVLSRAQYERRLSVLRFMKKINTAQFLLEVIAAEGSGFGSI